MTLLSWTFVMLSAAAAAEEAAARQDVPDVAIFANVRARELRFDEKPDVRVTVHGDVNGRPAATVSKTDRVNLPEEVQPRVLYRDIGILLTITSTLPDIETIVDEALAESPQTQPAPPKKSPH
jgi:hypothetical protein